MLSISAASAAMDFGDASIAEDNAISVDSFIEDASDSSIKGLSKDASLIKRTLKRML